MDMAASELVSFMTVLAIINTSPVSQLALNLLWAVPAFLRVACRGVVWAVALDSLFMP